MVARSQASTVGSCRFRPRAPINGWVVVARRRLPGRDSLPIRTCRPKLRVLAQYGVDRFLLGDSPAATNGFVVELHLVAKAIPVRELESGNWQAPVIDLTHQLKVVRLAKATL